MNIAPVKSFAKSVSRMLAVLLASTTLLAVPAQAAPCLLSAPGEDGNQQTPFRIASEADFLNIPNCDGPGVHFQVDNNITFTTRLVPFDLQGHLNGNTMTFHDIVVDTSSDAVRDNAGLFSELLPGSSVDSLTSGRVDAVSGKSAKLSGANLNDVTKIMIGETEIEFELSEDGDINLKVPANLEAGVYDLTVSYSGGTVVMQGALSVTSSTDEPGEARPSTKRGDDDTVKVRVFDVVNAGKVQIFVNDKEIVWIRATDFDDPKLSAFGYLVRTVMLQPGKNVIEVYVDGNRVDRKAYTKVESNSNNN